MWQPLGDDLDRLLEHTPELWQGLRQARVFLTGGTGFFGKWLLESFHHANQALGLDADIVVLTRSQAAFARAWPHLGSAPGFSFHDGDVRDFDFPPGRFTHVIHAATPSVNAPDDRILREIILEGTRRTLAFAIQARAGDFLFVSSGAVYGRQPSTITHIDEDYPEPFHDTYDQQSVYGESKRVAEQLCLACAQEHDLLVKIARCFAFVGPYLPLDAHFAIGNFIRDGLAGGPIRVQGDGTPYRSYLYAADLAGWLWTLLLRAPCDEPYNVGSDDDLTIAELARKVADYFGVPVEIARQPEPGAAPQRYVPSILAARAELGLDVWTTLDEAIDRTVRFHRQIHRPAEVST